MDTTDYEDHNYPLTKEQYDDLVCPDITYHDHTGRPVWHTFEVHNVIADMLIPGLLADPNLTHLHPFLAQFQGVIADEIEPAVSVFQAFQVEGGTGTVLRVRGSIPIPQGVPYPITRVPYRGENEPVATTHDPSLSWNFFIWAMTDGLYFTYTHACSQCSVV